MLFMKRLRPAGPAAPATGARWPRLVLILVMVLLTVAGLALLGTYFALSRQPVAAETAWQDPRMLVDPRAVAPDVAVLTLAGEPDDRIIRAALDGGERETAYATLVYSVLLPDAVRSGQWLILANAYQAPDPTRAAVAYQAAGDLAALGPMLGDAARADISLQAGRGYTALDKDWLAPLLIAQSENIARFSLTLLPAQRRDILTQVAAAYERAGQSSAAGSIRANLNAYSAGPGIVGQRAEPLLPTLRGGVVWPTSVVAAISARQQAAASLAARWLAAKGADRQALADALGAALMQEEAARATFYNAAGDLPLADSLALLHDRINWLTIKLRVSRAAYGVSFVPTWEAESDEIAAELSAAYTDLINGYGRQLDTLDPAEAVPARVELLRQGVLWVRLGLFPDTSAEDALSRQLSEASKDLWARQGGVGLTIVSQVERGLRLYLLAGSDARQ